jgi:hypothetical protein
MEQRPTEGSERGAETQRVQRFQFGPWLFNVNSARIIIAERPRQTWPLPVAAWARFYGLARPDGESCSLFTALPDLDQAHAMTTDLSEPVLMATMQNEAGQAFPLLIDGTHRLYRAYAEGVAELPAYVLDVDETRAIREDAYYR